MFTGPAVILPLQHVTGVWWQPDVLPQSEPVMISVSETVPVSGLLERPSNASACYVMAHGAGAGMMHPFMVAVADGLAERGIATLRYQFPYMEQGSKRPDRPPLAHTTVRAAIDAARRLCPTLSLIAGGKSFGGRMTSQAEAEASLPGVVGLTFFGFPLHPSKKPCTARAEQLARVNMPMLFLQGDRDGLADLPLLESVVGTLGRTAKLKIFHDADHSCHVPVRSARTDALVREEMLDAFLLWTKAL